MTLAEAETAAAQPGLPRRRQWLVWALLAAGVASVALAVLAAVASRYQPIGNGEDLSFAFPGLPAGKGFRVVNNLGGFSLRRIRPTATRDIRAGRHHHE
jgi:hypothetical protein